ncbi:SEC-C metal-binding domain-containing protein [Oceanicaulis alexandrii]
MTRPPDPGGLLDCQSALKNRCNDPCPCGSGRKYKKYCLKAGNW